MPELEPYIDTIHQKYADVFSEPSGLPPDRGIQDADDLVENVIPPFHHIHRLSPEEQREVIRHVTDVLKQQLIEPSSSYGSPILSVQKKSGSCPWRLAIGRSTRLQSTTNFLCLESMICLMSFMAISTLLLLPRLASTRLC